MRFLIALAIALAPSAIAGDVTPTEYTHGCVMHFCNMAGGCSFTFFVKVADDEYDSSEGEPQIWGYDPDNKQYDKDGHIRFVTALAKRFVRSGSAGKIAGEACLCKCPSW